MSASLAFKNGVYDIENNTFESCDTSHLYKNFHISIDPTLILGMIHGKGNFFSSFFPSFIVEKIRTYLFILEFESFSRTFKENSVIISFLRKTFIEESLVDYFIDFLTLTLDSKGYRYLLYFYRNNNMIGFTTLLRFIRHLYADYSINGIDLHNNTHPIKRLINNKILFFPRPFRNDYMNSRILYDFIIEEKNTRLRDLHKNPMTFNMTSQIIYVTEYTQCYQLFLQNNQISQRLEESNPLWLHIKVIPILRESISYDKMRCDMLDILIEETNLSYFMNYLILRYRYLQLKRGNDPSNWLVDCPLVSEYTNELKKFNSTF